MNNPIDVLLCEHEIILCAIKKTLLFEPLIENDKTMFKAELKKMIVFFRNYADKYHHAKEEDILFPEMNKKNEILSDGVIKEMFDNHENFREHLLQVELFLKDNEFKMAFSEFEKYASALKDHIAVENEEVFQIAETLFDERELEKIYFKFMDSDSEIGSEEKLQFENDIANT